MSDINSVEYWMNNCIFVPIDTKDDYDYKMEPEYIVAQEYWNDKKNLLCDYYKDSVNLLQFIENITVLAFNEDKEGYYINMVIHNGIPVTRSSGGSHDYVNLEYNIKNQKRITIITYDGFLYDMDCWIDDMMDDMDYVDRERYYNFIDNMNYPNLTPCILSKIFTTLFDFFDKNILF